MRVIFTGGGTGGHLYPGLAIARALVRERPGIEPFFVGAGRGIERDVLPKCEFPYALFDLHPLYRRRPWKNLRTIVAGLGAWRRLGRLVRRERPVLVVGTGGYASGLMLEFARRRHIPIVQQVGDSFPGLTARRYARASVEIYVAFPEATRFLRTGPDTTVVDTGAPIDPPSSFTLPRATARAKWGFPGEGGRVLLVYGGSQGSRAINHAVAAMLALGLPDDLYVIWGTGRSTYEEFARLESERVRVRDYLSPISDAYAAADLAVARAGSMTTNELLAWTIPAILVPLPSAAAQHQTANAAALEQAGAAIHLPQQQLTGDRLHALLEELLTHPARLEALARSAERRARPRAAETIARRILAVIDRTAPPA